MADNLGLLSETDKPTKAPWFLACREQSCARTASLEPPVEQTKTGFWLEPPKASFPSFPNSSPLIRKRRATAEAKKTSRLATNRIGVLAVLALTGIVALLTPIQTYAS